MTSVRTLSGRLETAAGRVRDVPGVARVVFDAVGRDIPFAFACLATTDPATGLITGTVKSHPLPMGDDEFAAAEYGGPDLNLFADLARRPVPVGVLSVDTGGDVARCRRLRDYMTPTFGFTDEIRLVCRAKGVTWGLLALYRGADEPPFTRRDGQRLAAIAEPVADAIRRVLFLTVPGPGPAEAGPTILIVDATNRVADRTAAAEATLDDLGGLDHGSLPATVLTVVAVARTTAQRAESRIRGRSGRWLALQALALAGSEGNVVVTVAVAPPAAVGQLTIAARGLTGREQDVAGLVLQGASTKAIAAALFLSPHTVQDHLKAIFAKLGVSSRRELVAQLALPADG